MSTPEHETWTRRCALGPVEMHALDVACTPLARAYGMPYLVGSVMTRRDPRDVDVRLILPDDHQLFTDKRQTLVLNLAVSHMLRASTGLPIDFQFQPQTEANQHNKVRNPICGRWDQSFAERDVADPDTAALQAEVAEWQEWSNEVASMLPEEWDGDEAQQDIILRFVRAAVGEKARADAAEARLARVTALLDAPGDDVSCAGRDLTTPGCFAHDLAVRIRARVAGDEQAAEGEAWPFKPGDVLFVSPDDNMTPDALDAAPVGTIVRGVVPGDGAEVSARRAKDGWVFLHNDAWILSTAFAKHYAPLTVVSVPGVGGAA